MRARSWLAGTLAFACAAPGITGEARAQAPRGEAIPAGTPSAEAGIQAARSLGDAFSHVAEQVSRSVVTIRVEARVSGGGSLFERFGMPAPSDGFARGAGSGIIIRPDGYILTNHHVVSIANRLDVILNDGRSFEGRVVGTDPATDLAVVHIEARDLSAARFAPSGQVRVGEWVIAIGSPFGLDYTVTAGVVSAVGRAGLGGSEIEDYVQTDASINPGNSGGPLVDIDGRVVGINTMIAGRGTGIGFAVAADMAQRVAGQLIETGEVRRPYIGITFQELDEELARQLGAPPGTRGALVSEIVRGGPAARAGIEPGDIVVSIDGAPVSDGQELLRQILRREVGARVRLGVLRDGRETTVQVVTAERPRQAEEPPLRSSTDEDTSPVQPEGLGLTVEEVPRNLRGRLGLRANEAGVVVTHILPGSPAARARLRPGDLVLEADGAAVHQPAELQSSLRDGTALLRIRRGDEAFFAVLREPHTTTGASRRQ
jgi:serine protease Do